MLAGGRWHPWAKALRLPPSKVPSARCGGSEARHARDRGLKSGPSHTIVMMNSAAVSVLYKTKFAPLAEISKVNHTGKKMCISSEWHLTQQTGPSRTSPSIWALQAWAFCRHLPQYWQFSSSKDGLHYVTERAPRLGTLRTRR